MKRISLALLFSALLAFSGCWGSDGCCPPEDEQFAEPAGMAPAEQPEVQPEP